MTHALCLCRFELGRVAGTRAESRR